jgi:hypothetical protein
MPSLSDSPAHLSWLEAVRKGDSFFSVGPFLELTILNLTPLNKIQLIAHDLSPEDEIELVIDGKITTIERDKSSASVTIIRELDPSEFEWLCGRVISSHNNKFSCNRNSTASQEKAFAIKKIEVLFINTETWLRTLSPKEKKRVDQILDILAEAKAKLACGN